MSKRLTHKEQVEAIQKKNPNIEVLGEITGNKTKVLCRCKVCSHEWEVEPYRLKRGDGCPECTRLKRTLTHEEQIAAISEANPDVKVLEEITGDKIKVLCLCKICGHRWPARPYSLKAGRGCPKCGDPALSHEEQIAAIAAINPDVEVVGRVIKDNKRVLCRCKICGHEWPTNPHKLKLGRGCPKCADHGFLSHEQGHLYIMVDDLEIPTVMKVGVSIDAEARRDRVFKSAKKAGVGISDLHVVKTWKGSTDDMHALEKAMHQALSQYKVNFTEKFDGCQEFFYYRPEVFDTVEEVYKKICGK